MQPFIIIVIDAKIGQEIMVEKALYAASFVNDGWKTG